MSKKEILEKRHNQTLYLNFANIFLGFWLLFTPFAFGYHSELSIVNDVVCGVVVIIFALLSLSSCYKLPRWVLCFVGFWLNLAPLLFWAPHVSIYMNDTIIGVLLIAFSILIPGIPGFVESEGGGIPMGWSYNPSAWIQRIPVIALACVGWFISRYLAAYQLGYIDTVWDPVFGEGTKLVITSNLSHSFPISDAGLGAFAYTIEALMGCKGGPSRWRTMPWMVTLFAFLVVPLGIVSILLVISQPLIVGEWCFLCLLTALAMLVMVVLTLDEMFASISFLYEAKKAGLGFWRTFWLGGNLPDIKEDTKTPPFSSCPFKLMATWRYGIGFRWNLFLAALLGGSMMIAPWFFGIDGYAADSDHLFGALVIVIALIAMAEVTRPIRFLLKLIGLWMAIATWFVADHAWFIHTYHMTVGILLFLLAIPKGKIHYSYGLLNRFIHRY